jgi:uncharacterized protein with PIN domain
MDLDRKRAHSVVWCESCGSTWEGMHWMGAYTYDGAKLYQGADEPCPFRED